MRTFANLAVTALLLGLSGCMSTSPAWDARFGEAARVAAAQQVINPMASQSADTVSGVDGKAAQGAMNGYVKSFTKAESGTQSGASINFGTAGQ
ncbi:pilus assembly protein [Thauera aromatica]|uniref:pilus assembly protein n=1 Tax=Thauera aromatica TaxID=59405 RepID=UPI001FFD1C53|nr:pilus assembly protein [Thauera aromatica]MCK2097574.1 pilus assembly protein [Thauera aromatica]